VCSAHTGGYPGANHNPAVMRAYFYAVGVTSSSLLVHESAKSMHTRSMGGGENAVPFHREDVNLLGHATEQQGPGIARATPLVGSLGVGVAGKDNRVSQAKQAHKRTCTQALKHAKGQTNVEASDPSSAPGSRAVSRRQAKASFLTCDTHTQAIIRLAWPMARAGGRQGGEGRET